jgi:hypothetical protein
MPSVDTLRGLWRRTHLDTIKEKQIGPTLECLTDLFQLVHGVGTNVPGYEAGLSSGIRPNGTCRRHRNNIRAIS